MMKKQMHNVMLLLVTFFIAFIPNLQDVSHFSHRTTSDETLTSNDLITSSAAIMVSAPFIHHKWQPKPLFSTDQFLLDPLVEFIPLKGSPGAEFTSDSSSFLYFVMYHSNYLS